MPTITPPSSYQNSESSIFVEIYPSRIGTNSYVFSSNTKGTYGIMSATVNKNIRDSSGGKFAIQIPPGGPNGVDSRYSWTSILSPMSFVVIALSRGTSKRIFMLGVISRVRERQIWGRDGVERVISIEGYDFSYFFTAFSFYTMAYLGVLKANIDPGAAAWTLGLLGNDIEGTPVTMGYAWLTAVMLGISTTSNVGVLQNTNITYKGNLHTLSTVFGWWMEAFSEGTTSLSPILFPLLTDFMNSEGTWMSKFLTIFPWPFYEFFVITASAADYPNINGRGNSDSDGYGKVPSFTVNIPGFTSVFPTVVARVNPLPWASPAVTVPAESSTSPSGESVTPPTTGSMPVGYTSTRWKALNNYSLGTYSYLMSDVNYTSDEVANMFFINTTDVTLLSQGSSGQNLVAFAAELLGVTFSPYSISKYGFKSASADIRWLTTLTANSGPGEPLNLLAIAYTLLGKLSSYYIPTPNMLSGNVVFPLWPDVFPGCTFQYHPFKSIDQYLFYIEGVTHTFNFGGPSVTTLDISRGLLYSDYQKTSLMQALHLDLATRQDGTLQVRSEGNSTLPTSPSANTGNTGLVYYNLANSSIPLNPPALAPNPTVPGTTVSPGGKPITVSGSSSPIYTTPAGGTP